MTTPRIEVDYRVTLSDIIQVILILAALAAGWWRFDSRQSRVEMIQSQQTDTLAKVSAQSQANTDVLKVLLEEFKAFPPHRHADHIVTYPDGHVEQAPK